MNKIIVCALLSFLFVITSVSAQQASEDATLQQSTEQKSAEQQSTEPKSTEQASAATNDEQATSQSTDNISAPIDSGLQTSQDVKYYLAQENLQPMLAQAQEFLTLVRENTSPNEKGVVIILPEWQQAVAEPKALSFLGKTLPEQGWTTITIQPLNKPTNYPSKQEKLALAREENQKSLADYQQALAPIIKAVMEKAQDYPGIILMISQGQNAAQLQHYLADNTLTKPDLPNALILLSAFMASEAENALFNQQVANSGVATLDLILLRDHPLVVNNAKQRKLLAKKEMKVIYRQHQFRNLTPGYYPEQALIKQINGWLRSIGW
ncbi:DUF3530 family protein [Thalassotalea sp. PLHSN55]|uniref:DUF3530 family protein n=1 Tax=Thalassotalea sp. PLHSN55 TaxID=3435888 RepID=UPI003F87B54D